ncbi:MFS transporter [Pseudoalteromonas sp. T1lg65]|uniref:MFS transporter n=1 Tax=Pseudoalteromonas sp. T1lg65 TaxID=2077101 RepID=UPI003F7A9AF0
MSKISEDIYSKLTNDDSARSCDAISDKACREVPSNYLLILFSQLMNRLGDTFLNPKITLPWLLQSVGAPAYLIAALVPIRESGSMLPQLFIGLWVRQQPVRKYLWSFGALVQAGCVMVIAMIAFQAQNSEITSSLFAWLIIIMLLIFSLARSLSSVAAKDVLGKTIPKHKRGHLNGQASMLSGLITMSIGVGLVLYDSIYSHFGFTLILCFAAVFWIIGAVAFVQIIEYKGATEGGKNGRLQVAKDIVLLKHHPKLLRFILVRSLLLSSALIPPYFTVLAQQNVSEAPWMFATLLATSGLAGVTSGHFWGKLADNSSKKVMYYGGTLTIIVTLFMLIALHFGQSFLKQMWCIPLAYFFITIAHQGIRIGRKTYVVDMADDNLRTSYVTISNTIIGMVLLLTSGLGFIASIFSITALLWLYLILTLLGIALLSKLPDVT